jgi:hypothetical protein
MGYKDAFKYILILCLSVALFPEAAWADEKLPRAESYMPSVEDVMKEKALLDDKRELFETYHPKDVLPPEVWNLMHFDQNKMRQLWAELVGLTAPDLVGKIAPEIKPGKYTYKDVEQSPGLQKLFPPVVLKTIKAGGPPHIGNIMDFEIEPTSQFFMALPAAEITKRNLGKTKLDKDGYIVAGTWGGGIPFPKPSGKFKAQQIYYNYEKNCTQYDETYLLTGEAVSCGRNLKIDKYSKFVRTSLKLMGRSFLPPFGWFDNRAKRRGEFLADAIEIFEPRANRGMVILLLRYDDPSTMDPTMIYLPQLRRIRKMCSTDTQDPIGDSCYDDTGFLRQKMSPHRFPYKFDIIEEREYLCPWTYNRGKGYFDSKSGYAIRNVSFQRRACYVFQMTQLDPNYIYSKRVYWIDKETFIPAYGDFYDQKGRLYRTYNIARIFLPDSGQIISHGLPAWQVDYVDNHSTCVLPTLLPATWTRRNLSMEYMIKRGK